MFDLQVVIKDKKIGSIHAHIMIWYDFTYMVTIIRTVHLQ